MLVLLVAALTVALLAGCGEEEGGEPAAALGEVPQPGGTLRLAVPGAIKTLDPLFADGRAERLAARQVHEPLVTRQAGPFGQTRQRPGLIRSLVATEGETIWTAKLRPGVSFQDGDPLDADAVLANVDRWLATATGRALVPELIVADSPQPGVVRFQLNQSSSVFPRRLSSARLGIVAPGALAGLGGAPLPVGAVRTGSGPFELREREAGRTLLARNATWWGSPVGLGPGVDQLEVLDVGSGRVRVDQLVSGAVEVAAALAPDLSRRVLANPLLTVVRGGGSALGMERSVRGIETAEIDQSLADAWLTDVR